MKTYRLVTLRLNESDYAKLCEVREKDDEQSFCALVRRLIRRRHKTLFNPNPNKLVFSAPGLRT